MLGCNLAAGGYRHGDGGHLGAVVHKGWDVKALSLSFVMDIPIIQKAVPGDTGEKDVI